MATSSREPKYLHMLVMQDLQEPAVFHGLIENWPASVWTPDSLASVLGDQKMKMRIGLKEAKEWESTQWKSSCSYETTTLSNFCSWLKQSGGKPQNTHGDNPLQQYDPKKYWCYIDYRYMAQVFEDHPDILQAVMWSDFGFEGRNGAQSTIWIGSEGATTPGHHDTYGCNLVAQIYGRKKWHLFPPHQSPALYQTRVPYEESSIFSPINISNPDLTKYPQFSSATPYIVTLDPVLFVPHHWWHFVESLETSVSVNTWIEMEADHGARFHEAITRTLASGILQASDNDGKCKWLNPTEELFDSSTNLACLQKAHEEFVQHQQTRISTNSTDQSASISSPNHILETSDSAAQRDIDPNNKLNSESSNDSPPLKRQKHTPDPHMPKYGVKVPNFVTAVPCLGQIYQKQNSSQSKCLSNSVENALSNVPGLTPEEGAGLEHGRDVWVGKDGTVKNTLSEVPSSTLEGVGLEHGRQEWVWKDGTQQEVDRSDQDHDGDGMTRDIFKTFLESVTDPEVVKHIGAVFCRKMKETC